MISICQVGQGRILILLSGITVSAEVLDAHSEKSLKHFWVWGLSVFFPHRNRWKCVNFNEKVTYESKWPAWGHSNKFKQCYLKQIQTTSPTLKPEVSTWVKIGPQCFAPVVTYLLIMAAVSFPSAFFKAWRYVPSPFPNAAQLEKQHSWSLRISSTTFGIFA